MFNYFTKKPTNSRDWLEDLKVLPSAEINGTEVRINNIRNFKYRSEFDFTPGYYDRTFKITALTSCEIGIVSFSKNPLIAHILLKYAFTDSSDVVFSVEVRKQRGQKFIAWRAALRNYELIYVIGDKNDLVELREKHRVNEPVYFYRLNFNQEQLARMFLEMVTRANHLKNHPEFFNLFTNSCASNVIDHINSVSKNKIHWFYKLFAPGLLRKELLKDGIIS